MGLNWQKQEEDPLYKLSSPHFAATIVDQVPSGEKESSKCQESGGTMTHISNFLEKNRKETEVTLVT